MVMCWDVLVEMAWCSAGLYDEYGGFFLTMTVGLQKMEISRSRHRSIVIYAFLRESRLQPIIRRNGQTLLKLYFKLSKSDAVLFLPFLGI